MNARPVRVWDAETGHLRMRMLRAQDDEAGSGLVLGQAPLPPVLRTMQGALPPADRTRARAGTAPSQAVGRPPQATDRPPGPQAAPRAAAVQAGPDRADLAHLALALTGARP